MHVFVFEFETINVIKMNDKKVNICTNNKTKRKKANVNIPLKNIVLKSVSIIFETMRNKTSYIL